MVKTVQIRVDKSLAEILESIRHDMARDLKHKYGLDEITVPGTLTSQVLAAKLKGQKTINLRIDKVNPRRGILRIL